MIDPQAVEDVLNSCNSPKTREVYDYCLKRFMRWYSETKRNELNASTLIAYRATLTQSELSSSTINTNLSAAKRLAYYQNQDDAMTVWKIERQVKIVSPNRVKRRKSLTIEQIKQILAVCNNGTLRGCRDEAMIAILFGAGLRRSDVVKLDLKDFDGMDIAIRQGKGRKTRHTPLPDWVIKRLNAWLEVRPKDTTDNALFLTRAKRRMADPNVYMVFLERTKQAGLKGLHPHNARTTYVTQLLKLKNDIAIVSRLVGHSDITTTTAYDLRDDEELRIAVNSFKLD